MYVNAKAELVTLAPGLRPERRFAPLARGIVMIKILPLHQTMVPFETRCNIKPLLLIAISERSM